MPAPKPRIRFAGHAASVWFDVNWQGRDVSRPGELADRAGARAARHRRARRARAAPRPVADRSRTSRTCASSSCRSCPPPSPTLTESPTPLADVFRLSASWSQLLRVPRLESSMKRLAVLALIFAACGDNKSAATTDAPTSPSIDAPGSAASSAKPHAARRRRQLRLDPACSPISTSTRAS